MGDSKATQDCTRRGRLLAVAAYCGGSFQCGKFPQMVFDTFVHIVIQIGFDMRCDVALLHVFGKVPSDVASKIRGSRSPTLSDA